MISEGNDVMTATKVKMTADELASVIAQNLGQRPAQIAVFHTPLRAGVQVLS